MTLEDRDAYIINRLAALAAQGTTGRQAVSELIRTAGTDYIVLLGHDQPATETDVAGLQSAVAALTVPATRASTIADPNKGKKKLYPLPKDVSQLTAWQLRALAAGA